MEFCYEISEKVGLAEDEEGNFTKAYMKLTLELEFEDEESTERFHIGVGRQFIANECECEIDMIKHISYEEYLENVEEDI